MTIRSTVQGRAGNLNQKGNRIAHGASASPFVETMTRLGYIVRGLVYGVIGVLAFQVAIGTGGGLNDTQGAISALSRPPLGGILLYFILVGLVGYSLWGVIRAGLDTPSKSGGLKEIVERVGFAVSGISYALLAYATYGLITAKASAAQNGAQGAQAQQTTASILSNSWGPWVIGLAGLIIIGIGASQIVRGLHADFTKQFEVYALSTYRRIWMDRLGRFGTAARGVVFTLVGVFLFLAGYHHDPTLAKGIDGVLTALLHQPAGPLLLGIVALGLVALGSYSALSGFWLRRKS
jgi:hypothetical protein